MGIVWIVRGVGSWVEIALVDEKFIVYIIQAGIEVRLRCNCAARFFGTGGVMWFLECLWCSYLYLVFVADEAGVVARWKCDAFAAARPRTHTVAIIGISVCTATPRSHPKCQQCIQFYPSVKVSKQNGDGKKSNIFWFSNEKTDQLHNLCYKHEYQLSNYCNYLMVRRPRCSSLEWKEDDERIKGEGQGGKSGNMQSIHTPRLLMPNMSLGD